MTYVDSVLEPGETVRYRATVSWTGYLPAILLTLAAAAILIAGAESPGLAAACLFIAVLLLLAAAVAFVPTWFRRWTTEIAVTDRRIVLKRGLVQRHTIEMNMQKVESVDVDQSLAGRLFNYGDVTIRGAGSTFETLRRVDSPLRLRSTITAG